LLRWENVHRTNKHRSKLKVKHHSRCDTLSQLCEGIQVAQLGQRDRAKLDTFSINGQRYSQNHAGNCIFEPPYGGIRGNISTLSESFNAKKLRSRVSSREY